MKRLRIPKHVRDKLRYCPKGCTQRRTINNWLSEKKSFDGIKCYNCGFKINPSDDKPLYQRFSIKI